MSSSNVPRLEDYCSSEKFGFILSNPLTELPAYFAEWNEFTANASSYIEDGNVRDKIEQMPVLDYEQLEGHRQLRLAHLMLTGMASCYVWCQGYDGIPKTLPKSVAVPLYRVSEVLGLPPVVCVSSWAHANWKIKDQTKPISDFDNREVILRIPGGETMECFLSVTQQCDLACGRGIQAAVHAQQAVNDKDDEALTRNLDIIASNLIELKEHLSKIQDGCVPEVFINVFRPYVSGWGSEAFRDIGYGGLVFEGISDNVQKHCGGTAAQSPALPLIDAALGIIHETQSVKFHKTMREYMLPAHKRLIEAVECGPSIREYVKKSNNMKASSAYDACLRRLAEYRSYHLRIVVRFLAMPSSKTTNSKPIQGTGGTHAVKYLKSTRTATKESILNTDD